MGKLLVAGAAEMAGVSYRQMQRIVARCREQYGDCGPTYARERLLMEGYRAPSVETAAEVIEGGWDGQGLVSYGATGASAVAATDGV